MAWKTIDLAAQRKKYNVIGPQNPQSQRQCAARGSKRKPDAYCHPAGNDGVLRADDLSRYAQGQADSHEHACREGQHAVRVDCVVVRTCALDIALVDQQMDVFAFCDSETARRHIFA